MSYCSKGREKGNEKRDRWGKKLLAIRQVFFFLKGEISIAIVFYQRLVEICESI